MANTSLIAEIARKLAWPKGTSSSKYKYPSGAPTAAFKRAKANTYGSSYGWSTASKKGASCDMFVGVCIRSSGYDKSWPAGLHKAFAHAKSSKKWKEIKYNYKVSDLRPGDVMFSHHRKSKRHPNWSIGKAHHIFLYTGNGDISQASANSKYGYTGTMSISSQRSRETWVRVFRPTNSNYSGTDSDIFYGDEGGLDDGRALVLENSISQLYSTGNYKWVEQEKEESEEAKRLKQHQQSLKDFLSNINISDNKHNVAPVDVNVSYSAIKSSKQSIFKLDKLKSATSTQSLISYPSLVEAPVIELSFNGITIGGYGNKGDKYPNYISSMSVKKINGRINTYTINLVYQVRAGEDPNFIDKLISNTGYLKPLKIIYGDANSPGTIFKEESAVITDVKSQDSVSSSQINYTITAISSVTSADKTYYSFSQKTDKPSNIINNLLYNSGEVSTQLQAAFPKMTDKNFVTSNNLIPNNDSVVTVGGMADVSPLTYLTHVVSCMLNVANSTSYFLTFNDSKDGAYFNIAEVAPIMDSNVLYEVDVGYPGSNFVTNFQLCDNIYWPLVYEYNGSISKWEYDIDNYGNINKYKTNSLHTDNKYLASSIINSNWWKSLTEFPISAKLTLKGLTIPVMLMTYIRVNTLFYGQKDIASGIYVVTDQEDSISGNGYSTTLTLLRVSD